MPRHQPPSGSHQPRAMSHPSAEGSPPRVPQPFRHHNPDGSVNEDSLFDVSRRFMYIRQQVSMAPTEIIALANHLCAHFDMRGMTAPPPIQAIRTSVRVRLALPQKGDDSKTNNDSSTRTHHKKTSPDKAQAISTVIVGEVLP